MIRIVIVIVLSGIVRLSAQTTNPITPTPTPVAFGELRLGTRATIDVQITNTDSVKHAIRSVELKIGAYFTVKNNASLLNVDLAPGSSTTASIEYDAARETQDVESDFDIDSLRIHADCGTVLVAVNGVASVPKIEVDDFDAGVVDPGAVQCKPNGLRFYNNGSDTVIVTGFSQIHGSNFSLSDEAIREFPFTIAPKRTFVLQGPCYQRADIGADSIVVFFYADARFPKDTSIWNGRTATTAVHEQPSPQVRVHIESGSILVAWERASVSHVTLTSVLGEVLASAGVASDARQTSVSVPGLANQPMFVMVHNSRGEIIHMEAFMP